MAKFTKLQAKKHYAIDDTNGDGIAQVWGFVALRADSDWPVGAKAFPSDDGDAPAVDTAT